MGIFGSEKEEESGEIQEVAQTVDDVKSHLNALDNAVQHHDKEIDQMVEALTSEGNVSQYIETNAENIDSLKKVFRKFTDIQAEHIQRVDLLDSELKETNEEISGVKSKINSQINKKLDKLKDRQDKIAIKVERLNDKIDRIEEDFNMDASRQERNIDHKVNKSEYSERKQRVDAELSKLKTRINNIQEDDEEEEIKIE